MLTYILLACLIFSIGALESKEISKNGNKTKELSSQTKANSKTMDLFNRQLYENAYNGNSPQLKTMLAMSIFPQMMSILGLDPTTVDVKSILNYFTEVKSVLSEEHNGIVNMCITDVEAYIKGIVRGETWALKMLDATGKPGRSILQGALKFLGNYDVCLEIQHELTNGSSSTNHVVRGNYCRVMFKLPSSFMNTTTSQMPLNLGMVTLQWDFCLPKSCNDSQVMEAFLQLPLNSTGASVLSATFVKTKDWHDDGFALAAMIVLSIAVLLTIFGTAYDVIKTETNERRTLENGGNINDAFVSDQRHNDPHVKNGQSQKTIENVEISQKLDLLEKERDEKRFGRQVLLSFSLRRNTSKILNIRAGAGNLGCIHGIRVISMSWVILGHSMTWDNLQSWENVLDYENWMRLYIMQFMVNGTLSVDTFFVLSGCLVTYLFLKEHQRSKRPTAGQMVLYYVHRYWRLTPVYMVAILIYTGLLDYMISGPLAYGKDISDHNNCRDNWWKNILYINNFQEFPSMCIPASWFLAHDMQFYVIAPLALLPLAYGLPWLGYLVISVLLGTHISTYGYLEWKTGGSTQFVDNHDYMNEIYRLPWCRVGVFAVGMMLGVLLHKTNCKYRMRRMSVLLCWLVLGTLGMLCTYVTYDEFRDGRGTWGEVTRSVYETLYRPLWGVFVAGVIFICSTNHGGFINTILSWGAWVPLGRLTYGAYLFHPMLLSYTEYSVGSLRYADLTFVSYHFIGTFIISYALSYIASVLVESPCMALEKAVLSKLRIKRQ